MIRHRVATPWLWAHRVVSRLRRPEDGFRILLFHDIPDRDWTRFEALVAYVVDTHGTLTPGQAAAVLDGQVPPQSRRHIGRLPCLFSFDDGFVSNHTVAKRILSDYKVSGLFFVSPGLTDLSGADQRAAVARNVFQGRVGADDLAPDRRLMSWEELAELKAMGHEIGCHGMSHRRLTELAGTDRGLEIKVSGDVLDDRLHQKTQWYAFAFGDRASIDAASLRVIGERYRYCRSGLRGANGPATPGLALCGDSLQPAAPLAYQKLLLEGGLDFRYRDGVAQIADWAGRGASPA